ncbi:extracellular solute-binding protein [Paenibacillus cymbidii]|uniref:extracellular solute-binding protein n=1 Tax=Paenibacillus cymbidii TaxID=1639034 RepID=UPI0014367753|nr:extracellular solute-binding protein [Paenibacillus cymbidii]
MTRRVVHVSLCLALIVSVLLSACSKKDDGAAAGSPSASASAGASIKPSSSAAASPAPVVIDPFAKHNPPIAISTVRRIDASMKLPAGQTYEDNVWTKALASELGINVNVTWTADGSQYDNKLNVTIASGALPDLMRVNAAQLKQLIESNSLEDLTDVFNKYASPDTKKQYAVGDSIALKSAQVGGKLYAIPNTASAIAGAASPLVWVRSDWMKKLNLQPPKTMQDLLTIARAFTNNDPDGNGKKDTVGYAFTNNFLESGLGNLGFFNGYHAYPSIWVKDKTGKLVYGSTQPEMKKALQDLQQLYKDGAIDQEFTVKDGAKVIDMITAGQVGILTSAHYFGQFTHKLKVRDPNAEWTPYPLLSIDSEPAKVGLKSPALEYYVVRKGYKNPEAIVQMFNFYYKMTVGKDATQEAYDRFMYDKSDGSIQLWKFSPVSTNDATDEPFMQMVDAFDTKDPNKAVAMDAKTIYGNAMKAQAGENSLFGWTLYYPAWKIIKDVMDKKLTLNTAFYGAPTATMTDKNATLLKLEYETFTKIIMGAAPIEEFDKFVENWSKLGGDQITGEVNAWSKTQN